MQRYLLVLLLFFTSVVWAAQWEIIDVPDSDNFVFTTESESEREVDGSFVPSEIACWSRPQKIPFECGPYKQCLKVRVVYNEVWQRITALMYAFGESFSEKDAAWSIVSQHKNPRMTKLPDGTTAVRCRCQGWIRVWGLEQRDATFHFDSNPVSRYDVYRLKAAIEWYRDTYLKEKEDSPN